MLIRVWVKINLPLKSPVTHFLEVPLRSLTTWNREVSSANSLHSPLRSSDKSPVYIKNNKYPSNDQWRTPAQTSTQDEHWPFKTTLCFLLRRKPLKILMISPLISFSRSLKVRLSYHTLLWKIRGMHGPFPVYYCL